MTEVSYFPILSICETLSLPVSIEGVGQGSSEGATVSSVESPARAAVGMRVEGLDLRPP